MQVYWLEQAESGAPARDEWLSELELATRAKLRIPKRRADWRLGRWTAKCAVAARLGIPATPAALSEIEARPAASGAPRAYLRGRALDLAISISHSHGRAFCAVADAGAALGCDVEKIERRGPEFAADYFTPEEQALVDGSGRHHRDTLLTLLWSGKESALKALECGLRADPRCVSAAPVEGDPCGSWRPLVAFHSGGAVLTGWWRASDEFVWTILMMPAPSPPVALHFATDAAPLVRGSTQFAAAR